MKRPTVATVFGVLNIIFGLSGVFSFLFVVMLSLPMVGPWGQNPALGLMSQDATLRGATTVLDVVGLVASVLLLVGGVGLLRVAQWGRKLSIDFAVLALLNGLAGLFVTFRVVIPGLTASGNPTAWALEPLVRAAALGQMILLTFPVALLIFMLRPKLREQIDRYNRWQAQGCPNRQLTQQAQQGL